MLQLFCLCTPQIHRATEATPVHLTPKAMGIFVYLAVTQRPHSRDVLADLLWSEMNNRQARTNLRYLLPELRRPLDDYLTITTKYIGFNRQAPYWLDVEVLQTTLSARPESVNNQALQAALDLYQAEFLAGFTIRDAPVFEAWLVQQRESLHLLVVQGGYRLAEGYWRQADYANALAITHRLLQWEPWHEAGHRLQMQLLAITGQRAAALAQYARCQQILADELGVAPETATTALYEQIQNGEFAEQQTSRQKEGKTRKQEDKKIGSVDASLPPVSHNLPRQTTSFIGRDDEVAELCAKLLTADCRLLTLVGEGGIGKTRLALAVAQWIVERERWPSGRPVDSHAPTTERPLRHYPPSTLHGAPAGPPFPDGVWFVPLNDLTAGSDLADRLATVVAKTIGLSFSGNQPLFTQLLAELQRKTFCLLFDNAEHLLPAINDFLLQILQQSPRTTVLATSRHVLNLQAETIWRVAGLPIPPPVAPAALSLRELTSYSSIALFVERAKRTQERLPLTLEDGPSVAAICRLVDGLPLAIELAAALTKQYTYAELYDALQRDYTILAATEFDHALHHRSIQTMLDYSWRFLTAEEARLLAACAIFAGGFTRAAVQAVTTSAPALLLNLIDQSLIQMREGRFFMHELVRHYAAAQLAQAPECQARIAAAHATYYIDLLHSLQAALVADEEAQQHIQGEIENIRTAWYWSVAQANLALLDKGVESLQSFYHLAGLYREGLHLLTTALDGVKRTSFTDPTAALLQPLRVRLLCYSAQFYRRLGELQSCERYASNALALAHRLADPALQGLAYHELARLAYVRGNFLLMDELAEQGYKQARQTKLLHLTAECLNDRGLAVGMCQGPLAAITPFREALHLLQGGDNRFLQAFIFVNLGFFYLSCHQYQWACDHLQQGITIQRQFQIRGGSSMPLRYLGDLWLALGLYEEAQQQYEQVLALLTTMYNHYSMSGFYTSYGRLQHLRGDPKAAIATCTLAYQLAQQGGVVIQAQWALVFLAHALLAAGETAAAEHHYRQALALHNAGNWVYRTADAHAGLATLLLANDKVASAVAQIDAALDLLAQHGLAGANEPFTVYWTAVRVLQAANDPRADTVLRSAYQALQEISAQLTDRSWRRSFLEDVVVNRHLLTAAQDAGVIP